MWQFPFLLFLNVSHPFIYSMTEEMLMIPEPYSVLFLLLPADYRARIDGVLNGDDVLPKCRTILFCGHCERSNSSYRSAVANLVS